MVIPLAFSLYYREPDALAFLISMAITAGAGLSLWLLARPGRDRLGRREALLLVAAIWITAAVFGALPYKLSGTFPNYLNAYFEAMSGFTTTGASVLTSIESQPHGILLWRDLTQWLGGMGIVMLFVAIFPALGVGAAHMVEGELPGPKAERLTARIRDTARILWQLYLGLSAMEVMALLVAGLPFFDALLNTLGTMPTGGFCPRDLSIAAYSSVPVEGIIIFFMVLAGTNFQLFYLILWKRQFRNFLADRELRWYFTIWATASLLIVLDLIMNMGCSVGNAFRYATFQAVSIQTTTGFSNTDFAAWPWFSQSVLLVLMIIGASAFSTGGALKVIRVVVLAKYAYRQVLLVFSPRAIRPLKLAGKVLPERVVSEIVGLSILYFATLVLGSVVMSAMGLDTVSAFSSVAATLGNVGPGLGSVGPAANYFLIPGVGKVVLTFCMLVGRLELWTVLVLITPAFWKAR
jgi:trk system potassium uptake protein TrkH